MEVELKTKWVQALRSGDYKQGRATLMDEYGRCCVLGVLCDVAGIPVTVNGNNHEAYSKLEELLGTKPRRLWRRNDIAELTFPELADWIEETL